MIAGGGIAGLETLIALRSLVEQPLEITLVASQPDFVYRPMLVEEPFSPEPAERLGLADLAAELDARFVQRAVEAVDPTAHEVTLEGGEEVGYDMIVVCVGAREAPAFSGVVTFHTGDEPTGLGELLPAEGERTVAFVVPPGATWPLPAYELALMTKHRAESLDRHEVRCTIFTPESAPLIMFGSVASDAVAEVLRARGIEIRTGVWPREDEGGLVLIPGHERLEADRIVALPVLHGPALGGLDADPDGFLPIDEHARVKGTDDVYAAGDGTTFPIKHGGLGTQQADAAAEHIAARLGADLEPHPFHPILRGKLLLGEESLSLAQDLQGGAGEGVASQDYLWWPPHKVSGRYLAPWLAGEIPHLEPVPPAHPLDVEVSLPKEWHSEPMALDPYEPLPRDPGR